MVDVNIRMITDKLYALAVPRVFRVFTLFIFLNICSFVAWFVVSFVGVRMQRPHDDEQRG